ncbi:BCCT family transporter [Bacillus thermotolerans]|uniref:High-affinity choline uptake protein BetT n=1 Tax=Bacillus thermotolerans TaxID=1221996 RepID=A0A0F5I823_BACTR|nr:BCCT family transporter [Bacillus thermotolerans]KKB41337.1 High-affinity choline uptake protein BetT [Bacillus thermotolerans]
MEQSRVDKFIFSVALIVLGIFTVPVLINPEKGNQFLGSVLGLISGKFGALYLLVTFLIFCTLMYLAFSKYGGIKLGDKDEKPEFSTVSWMGLIFTSTAGSSLLYWGFIEWTYYYTAPPFGISPGSVEAAEWASTYGIFHWGFMGFAIYCLPSIALAYALYVRKVPNTRLSSACRGVLGDRVDGYLGKCIDIMFMFGIVGGVGTSLGLGTPMLSEAISGLTGIERSLGLDLAIIAFWTAIFSASVYFGLKKGLKILSDININIYLIFALFFFIAGPTVFIINKFTDSMGLLVQNFLRMSLYTDSIGGSTFAQDWTIFYWAWWFALAPFMAMFTARISKGRTIRSVVVAMCVGGTLGCALAFSVFGNTSLYFEMNDIVPVIDIVQNEGAPAAIVAMIQAMPFGSGALLAVFVVLAFIFLATTIDSAAYTLSSMSTQATTEEKEPARWVRLFWAAVIGSVAIILMYGGGLQALQTLSVITGFPIMFISIIIGVSLLKWLKEDSTVSSAVSVPPKKEYPPEKKSS